MVTDNRLNALSLSYKITNTPLDLLDREELVNEVKALEDRLTMLEVLNRKLNTMLAKLEERS